MSEFTSTVESQNARLIAERAHLLKSIEAKVGAEARRVAEIETKLVETLPFGQTVAHTPAGPVTVVKSANRRVQKDVAAAQLRPGQLQRVTVRVIDTDLLRKSYPLVHAASVKEFSPKLTWR